MPRGLRGGTRRSHGYAKEGEKLAAMFYRVDALLDSGPRRMLLGSKCHLNALVLFVYKVQRNGNIQTVTTYASH